MTEPDPAEMFRPPINRAMKVLDRSYFQKKVPLAAARILEKKHIARFRTELGSDILNLERVSSVKDDPQDKGSKALLLKPDITCDSTCRFLSCSSCSCSIVSSSSMSCLWFPSHSNARSSPSPNKWNNES